MSTAKQSTAPASRQDAPRWCGQGWFVLRELILTDFKVRYRNMSLGVFWSLLNPLVMMGVLWFVFTRVFSNKTPAFGAFALCGIVPFNFFSLAWLTATASLVERADLIKRVPAPRHVAPLAAVLSISVHLLIQLGLVLASVLIAGKPPNRYWLLLPLICGMEVIFVCGLGLIFAALNVYIRDVRYVVESANTVLFWLVPIFYSFSIIPPQYREIYQLNPVAAVVLAIRNILLDGVPPPGSLMVKLTCSSVLMLVLGLGVFRLLERKFYDYL